MIVAMCFNHSIHTLGGRVNIYIRRTCNQNINVYTVAGVAASAQVEL
jgi:hypothetical protein